MSLLFDRKYRVFKVLQICTMICLFQYPWQLVLASSSQAEHDQATKLFVERLAAIQDFDTDFQQWVLDERGDQIQEVQGKLRVQRPSKFYWETKDPFPQLILSNGKIVWIYDEDLEQVTQRQLDPRLTNTPALLLSGHLDDLESEFVVNMVEIKTGIHQFSLTPLNSDHQFSSLSITLAKDRIMEMQLEDALGQKTLIEFYRMTVNKGLDASIFEFEVPEGVDLIVDNVGLPTDE